MSDNNTTIVAEQSKTTENYAVYESAEVAGSQDLTGMYVSLAAFGENPPEFIEVTISDEGPVAIVKSKDTTNFAVYESESGAISGMYVSHDFLGSEETEDGFSGPSERGIAIAPATEEDFEQSQEDEAMQNEAEALLADSGTEDAVEVEEDEQSAEESEAEDLLSEAEDAA